MPDLDNHMDELFKKAAEDYPLKTTPGNFDGLLPFVAGSTTATGNKTASKAKRKTLAVLLAFLLLGGSVATYFIYNSKTGNSKTGISSARQQNKNQIKPEVKTNTSTVIQTENSYQTKKVKGNTKSKFSATILGSFAIAVDEETEPAKNTDLATTDTKLAYTSPAKTNISIVNAAAEISDDIVSEQTKAEIKKELIKTEQTASTSNPDKKKFKKPSFYYGIAAGAEFNQVKSQGMTKAAFNGGIVFGLQVSKKIAVETGVQLTQKKYYSKGEYFNPKTSDMPSTMKVMSLDGTSTIVEIPVSVKYNFSKKQRGFYGKAGISTYLMTKESNEYKAMVNGQQQNVNSSYNKAHCYTAAGLNLSVGYEHKLPQKLNIRVEPYIQIPLKGIGIGSLPVMSTGVHLVLTRN